MRSQQDNRKPKGENPRIVTWCQGKVNEEWAYMFQVQTKSTILSKRILQMLLGMEAGTGFDPNSKEVISLVRRLFSSKEEFREFANNFEYKMERLK